jgi:hypothetical protein
VTHGSDDHTSKGDVFLNASELDDSTAADASASIVVFILSVGV